MTDIDRDLFAVSSRQPAPAACESTKMDESLQHYVHDLVRLVRDQALGARADRDQAAAPDIDFANGRLMAYHEVVSLMQQQAEAFGIGLADLGLDAVNPERDLV
jgi:hypothetical protein